MPGESSLTSAWDIRVQRHHTQSLEAQAAMGNRKLDDYWRPLASRFKADPYRTDDSLVNLLLQDISPNSSVLDVGGGAGRLALPLALKCKHVTVVDPSESMLEQFRVTAGESNIRNITAYYSSWENAQVEPADVVLCAHVLYGIEDIEVFLRKLDRYSKRLVFIIMFLDSPQSYHSQIWKLVHGKERITLPAMKELLSILWKLGLYPNIEMLEDVPTPVYENLDEALHDLRLRLYVTPNTENERRLQKAVKELLVRTDEGVTFRYGERRQLALASWSK